MSDKSTSSLVVDISKLKEAVVKAEKAANAARAEFRKTTAGMDNWSKSTEGLNAKIKQLNTSVETEKLKLESLEAEYKQIVEKEGESSAAAKAHQVKIDNQTASVVRAEKELQKYKEKLSDLESDYSKATQAISKQEDELEALKKEYSNIILTQDKSSEAAQEVAAKIGKLSTELQENKKALEKADSAADEFDNTLEKVDDSAEEAGDGFTVMKGALANLVADGIRNIASNLATEIKNMFVESTKAYSNFQAQTGESTEAMAEFKEEIDDLYKNNYGDSLEDIADVMAKVKQQTNETDPSKLSSMTENALALRDTYEYDVTESLRAVKMLMDQFGISSDKAYNLIVQGAQQGLDKNGDLLDTINEYAVHYKQLGYNADQFISSLINGTEKGTFSVDKLGDAMKEFGIRTKDTADSTKEGFELLGYSSSVSDEEIAELNSEISKVEKNLKYAQIEQKNFNSKTSELTRQKNADKIQEYSDQLLELKSELSATSSQSGKTVEKIRNQFAKGGKSAQKATKEVLEKLMNMDDKVKQNQAGVDLFGTMWEDLGIEGVKALTNVTSRVDDTKDSMEELKKIKYDNIEDQFKTIGRRLQMDFLAPLAQKALPYVEKFADYCVNNLEKIVPVLKTIGGTIATAFVVNKVANFGNSLGTIVSGLGKIQGLSKGLGALSAVAITLGIINDNAIKAGIASEGTQKLTDVQQKSIDTVNELISSYDELEERRDDEVEKADSQIGYYDRLRKELDKIVDGNGKIKKGDEDRATFITSTLNDALGSQLKIEDGFITNYQTQKTELKKLIDLQKARSNLSANEELYNSAIKDEKTLRDVKNEAYNKLQEQNNTMIDTYYKLISIQGQSIDQWAKENKIKGTAKEKLIAYNNAVVDLQNELWGQYEIQQDLNESYKVANERYLKNQNTIKNYENLSAAIASGSEKKISNALLNIKNNFISYKNATKDMLSDQVENTKSTWESLAKAYENGEAGVTKKAVNNAKTIYNKAVKELDKFEKSGRKAGNDGITGFCKGMNKNVSLVVENGQIIAKAAKRGLESVSLVPTGKNFGEGFIIGLSSTDHTAEEMTMKWGINRVENLNKSIESHSPSKATTRTGIYFAQGFINAIKSLIAKAKAASKSLGGASLKALLLGVDDGKYSKVGEKLVKHFTNGINSQASNIVKTVKNLINNSIPKGSSSIDKAKKEFDKVAKQLTDSFSKALEKGASKAVKKVEKAFESISEEYQDKYDEIAQKQEDLQNTLSDYGSLFERDDDGKIELSNLNEQINYLEAYNSNLKALKSKVSSNLMGVITSMSAEDGADLAAKLLSLSPEELKAFDTAYLEKQKISAQIAKDYYKSEVQSLKDNFTKAINKQLKTLKKDLKEVGKQAVEGFIKGFKSKNSDVSDTVEAWAKSIIKTVKKQLKIKSPSRVFRYEIAGNVIDGFIKGIATRTRSAVNTMKEFSNKMTDSANILIGSAKRGMMLSSGGAVTTNNSNTTYNFYQTNNSPKALSRLEIYRQSRNLLNFKAGLKGV